MVLRLRNVSSYILIIHIHRTGTSEEACPNKLLGRSEKLGVARVGEGPDGVASLSQVTE